MEGSFLEELDEQNASVVFREVLAASISYMLLERCLDGTADQYDQLVDFSPVINFNTQNTVNALGVATSDMAEMVLREIAITVRNIEKRGKTGIRTFAVRTKQRIMKFITSTKLRT